MAGNADLRSSRHHAHHYSDDEHDYNQSHQRRRRHRDDRSDDGHRPLVRERSERRPVQVDVEERRIRRHSHYSRPEPETRRESQRMAHPRRTEREAEPRNSHREARRDGARRESRSKDRPADDHVHGRPQAGGFVEEVTLRRSSARRRRSDEGGSSSRTPQSPRSGSRPPSPRVAEASKPRRSKSTREPTRTYMAVRPSVRRSNTIRAPPFPPAPVPTLRRSSRDHVQRRSNSWLFANLFASQPRITTNTLHREASSPPTVECVACRSDDVLARKAAKLKCGHYMCRSCLRRLFTLSLTKPELMPPKCCTSDAIPMKHVDHLFDEEFKARWNRKLKEFSTSSRIYCANKGCGQWIDPSKIKRDLSGRRYARCDSCHTYVCVRCREKYHRGGCATDVDVDEVNRMAKEKGWQRCYHCKNMVELKDGCNHMTCICKAEFCMRCAKKWRTCECPLFNHEHIADDYYDIEPPVPPRNQAQGQTHMEQFLAIPLALRPRRGPPPLRGPTQAEMARTEDALTAMLHAQLALDDQQQRTSTPRAMRPSDPVVQVNGLGNAAIHHMNDSFQPRNAAQPRNQYAAPRRASPPPPVQRRASYSARPLAISAARAAARLTGVREHSSRHARVRSVPTMDTVQTSTMAGLARDGSKRGHNRVGTWVRYVQLDPDAVQTAPQDVEVDEWNVEGSMVGIP